MEPFFPTIWNVFHDGTIDRIEGDVPGEVTLYIGIEYLRERFAEAGEHFVVTLPDCSKFAYQDYKSELVTNDLAAIGDAGHGILMGEMVGETCRVFTETGTIDLESGIGQMRLDSEQAVSWPELFDVAKKYWDEFGSRSKKQE